MTFSGGGRPSDHKDMLSNPFDGEPRRGPTPRIIALEESSDGEASPFLNEFPSEAPAAQAPIPKLRPRSAPAQIRVSVLKEPEMPPAAVASVFDRQIDWRNVLLGVLAFVVVVQGAFIAFGMSESAVALPPTPASTTGSITVTSSPSGAPVAIDGAAIGLTPLSLPIAAGSHRIEVGAGSQHRVQDLSVTGGGDSVMHVEMAVTPPVVANAAPVAAAKTSSERTAIDRDARAAVAAAAPTGWLTVSSAVPMQVFENGALVGASETQRIPLRAGAHELTLVNAGLGYRVTRTVQIASGQGASISLTPPMGTLSINALPWAEVWINGRRVGETPIGNLSVVIGNHDVVFRHPNFGEQRRTVTVGTQGPVRVGVDMKTTP